jgi:multidrug efflux pump subunit AcrB
MTFSEIAVKNYQFTIIVVMLLILAGIFSFFTMPYTEDPPVSVPGASVIVIYAGASPSDMEQLVTDTIEESMDSLEDVKRITSNTRDSLSATSVEFKMGADIDKRYSEMVEAVNAIRNKLPDEITSIDTFRWGVSDVNILQLAIISDDASYRELKDQAEKLKKKLIQIEGIKKSETLAFPEQEVRISVDLGKLTQMHISLNQFFGAIQSANINIPGGTIDIGDKNYNVQTGGTYKSMEDIGNTVINSTGESIVYLKDVADLRFDYEDQTHIARFNEKRCVFVTASQEPDSNIFKIMRKVKPMLAEYENQLPKSMTLSYVFDQSASVARRLKSFSQELIQGILFVGIIVFLGLSFRTSFIVMLALPLSILIGIAFVHLWGYGIQQMTIAGLIIALGMLVDDAIVVTQNAARFMKMGFSPREAVLKSTAQIQWAITSCTATTVLSYVPLVFIKDVTGDFIRSMPLTVIFTLIASLFVAMTFTPLLFSIFVRPENPNKRKSEFINILPSALQKVEEKFIQKAYRRILDYALSHNKTIVIVSIVIFLGSLSLFPFIGRSLFPKAEKPNLIININASKGTNLDKTDELAKYVESVLKSRDEVKNYTTNVGNGNPRIYYNVMSESRDSAYAQFFVELKEYDKKIINKLLVELRGEFAKHPEAGIEVKELEQGPGGENPIAIRIIGANLDTLKDISLDVQKIIAETPGTVNIDNPLEATIMDLHVNINREKAGMMGVSLLDINRTVRAAVAGIPISKYRDAEGEEYNIIVRLPYNKKITTDDLDNIYLTSLMGVQVPLRQVASFEFIPGAQGISHYKLDRCVIIGSDVLSGYIVNKVTKDIVSKLDEYKWQKGYYYKLGGELESEVTAFSGLGQATILALITIFAILVLQFRSFAKPLIVFVSIPLAVVGAVLALLITRNSFSFTAFVGLTSLIGIVVRNAIILIEYINQLRESGKDLLSAIKEAGETRFQPIILTTATTIGGLLPLTLQGGTLWAPMGWVIIGGLTVSTVLTLIVVPVLYKIFSSKHTL